MYFLVNFLSLGKSGLGGKSEEGLGIPVPDISSPDW